MYICMYTFLCAKQLHLLPGLKVRNLGNFSYYEQESNGLYATQKRQTRTGLKKLISHIALPGV